MSIIFRKLLAIIVALFICVVMTPLIIVAAVMDSMWDIYDFIKFVFNELNKILAL